MLGAAQQVIDHIDHSGLASDDGQISCGPDQKSTCAVSLMRSRSMRRSPSGTWTVYSSGAGSTSGFVGGTLGAGRDASCSAAA